MPCAALSLPLRGARQARGRSLKREISQLSRVVQLHHRTLVPPPYHSNLDMAAHIFLRRSAEFPEPADEFPDARRSIENLMLHCSAQCQQDFRHECLRSALPTMPTGRDPTTRRSRRSKKPRKTRGARRSAPPENNLAHARPKGPLRSPRSTMSSHRSGETFGRHARAISPSAARASSGVHRLHHPAALCFTPSACTSPMSTARASACTSPSSAPPGLHLPCAIAAKCSTRSMTRLARRPRCPPLPSCRGFVLYAFGLHFAGVHRSLALHVDDIGGVHRHGVTLGPAHATRDTQVAKWRRYFNRDDRCFLRRRREI